MACPLKSPCGIIEYHLLRGYPKYSREKNWFSLPKNEKWAEQDAICNMGCWKTMSLKSLENNVSHSLEKMVFFVLYLKCEGEMKIQACKDPEFISLHKISETVV